MQSRQFLPKLLAKVIKLCKLKSGIGSWTVLTQVLTPLQKKVEANRWQILSSLSMLTILFTTTTTWKQMHQLQQQARTPAQQTTHLAKQHSKLQSQSTSLRILRRLPGSISKTNVRRESRKWSQIRPVTNRQKHPLKQNWTTTELHMQRGSHIVMAWRALARLNQTNTSLLIDQALLLRKYSSFHYSKVYHLNQLPRFNQNGNRCGLHRDNTGVVRWTTILAAA